MTCADNLRSLTLVAALGGSGCILLVNDLSDGGGGSGPITDGGGGNGAGGAGAAGGGGEAPAGGAGGSEDGGGGMGGAAPTCPGGQTVERFTETFPTIDDIDVVDDVVRIAYRDATGNALLAVGDGTLANLDSTFIATGIDKPLTPISGVDADRTLVHISGTLFRVTHGSPPDVQDAIGIDILKRAFWQPGDSALYGAAAETNTHIRRYDIDLDAATLSFAPTDLQTLMSGRSVLELGSSEDELVWSASIPADGVELCGLPDCVLSSHVAIALTEAAEFAIDEGRMFVVARGTTAGARRVYAMDLDDSALGFRPVFDASLTGVEGIAVAGGATVVFGQKLAANNDVILVRCCGDGDIADLGAADCEQVNLPGTDTHDVQKIVAGPGPTSATILFTGLAGSMVMVVTW